jgi:hypothetical protein
VVGVQVNELLRLAWKHDKHQFADRDGYLNDPPKKLSPEAYEASLPARRRKYDALGAAGKLYWRECFPAHPVWVFSECLNRQLCFSPRAEQWFSLPSAAGRPDRRRPGLRAGPLGTPPRYAQHAR